MITNYYHTFLTLIDKGIIHLRNNEDELSIFLDAFKIDKTKPNNNFYQAILIIYPKKTGLFQLSVKSIFPEFTVVTLSPYGFVTQNPETELNGEGFKGFGIPLSGWIPVIHLEDSMEGEFCQEYVYYDDLEITCRIQFTENNRLNGISKHYSVAAALDNYCSETMLITKFITFTALSSIWPLVKISYKGNSVDYYDHWLHLNKGREGLQSIKSILLGNDRSYWIGSPCYNLRELISGDRSLYNASESSRLDWDTKYYYLYDIDNRILKQCQLKYGETQLALEEIKEVKGVQLLPGHKLLSLYAVSGGQVVTQYRAIKEGQYWYVARLNEPLFSIGHLTNDYNFNPEVILTYELLADSLSLASNHYRQDHRTLTYWTTEPGKCPAVDPLDQTLLSLLEASNEVKSSVHHHYECNEEGWRRVWVLQDKQIGYEPITGALVPNNYLIFKETPDYPEAMGHLNYDQSTGRYQLKLNNETDKDHYLGLIPPMDVYTGYGVIPSEEVFMYLNPWGEYYPFTSVLYTEINGEIAAAPYQFDPINKIANFEQETWDPNVAWSYHFMKPIYKPNDPSCSTIVLYDANTKTRYRFNKNSKLMDNFINNRGDAVK